MGWKITHVYGEEPKSRVGMHSRDYAGGNIMVRTLDDDRNPMYRAMIDDNEDSDESFLSFCIRDVGATILQERINGKWVDVIS